MRIPFHKYQGTGNDFVMIDQRELQYLSGEETALIARLCDRRFGIGADGLILLKQRKGYDFEMDYFNADGRRGSMCGNGGRCALAFAHALGLIKAEYHFWAPDGPHRARRRADGWVELQMAEVSTIEQGEGYCFLDTGSPHYVRFVPELQAVDVVAEGRRVRYSERFRAQGTNVNFVAQLPNGSLEVRTYERGVEDETLSCGTGVTAAVLAAACSLGAPSPQADAARTVSVQTKGGQLELRFRQSGQHFSDIWLCGPAALVFTGHIDVKTP